MTLHPGIQLRAQKEIDTIVSSGKLPDFDDREDLPFVNALFQETLRWNPVAPLGLAFILYLILISLITGIQASLTGLCMMISMKDIIFLRVCALPSQYYCRLIHTYYNQERQSCTMYGKNVSSHWRSIDRDAETIYRRGVTHDETLYGPNPHDFNPDRFTQANSKPPNPELFAFGFGRR